MPVTIANKIYNTPLFLAPMEDVTDAGFRKLCKELGADILTTEFISSEALIRNAWKAHKKMFVEQDERPIGIQIYGARKESLLEAAKMASAVEPDFIDLNVGCPVSKVADNGMGAGLLKNCDLLTTIVSGLKKFLSIPLTVKMRIGWDDQSINVHENVQILNELGVHWIAIHARTRAQGYKGSARWEYIKQAKAMSQVPIIGNGDVQSAEDAQRLYDETKCDGIMIGRGAIKRPWIFREIKTWFEKGIQLPEPDFDEKIHLARKHLEYLMAIKDGKLVARSFLRFSSSYFTGVKNVAKIRQKLATCRTGEEMLDVIDNISQII